ncbi:MAG: DUF1080 domain-containing protein [Pirellulales bacterium]|nr:DUF1080 domain-containing protein [Pirellulales bacterium]
MSATKTVLVVLILCVLPTLACGRPTAYTDPKDAGPAFAIQGEYEGTISTDSGEEKSGVQVIARGDDAFHAVAYKGGLPGAGWNKKDKGEADGKLVDGVVHFKAPNNKVEAFLADGVLTVKNGEGETIGTLKKVTRESPTLGAKPPAGAVVLFDGTSADAFDNGRMTEDKLLKEGVVSKQTFGDATIHVEFYTPFVPGGAEQGRGNSGCYVQGRYEIQILDSFGLEGLDNECGGIYQIARPAVNMCLPPLSWQTYDIDFTAAKYEDGKKVNNARITIRHNGVVIHDDLELEHGTPGGTMDEGPEPGPLFLQDHGDPVRFRNIWVVPKK